MIEKKNFHFVYSLLFHVVILSIFIVSFEFQSRTPVLENTKNKGEIVNAMIVTETKMEMPKPSVFTPPSKPVMPEPKKEIKTLPLPQPTPKKIAIPDDRQKKAQQELIEKQLLADLKKQTKKQKVVKSKEIEAAFAKELKEQAAKSLAQQFLKETKQLSAISQKQMQGIVDKYQALILQAISENWVVPNNVNKKLMSELMIRLAPGGMVLDVQVVKSSGDVALDRSARAAVFKASPLPVPTKTDEFEPFRQFVLKVKPENIS